MRNILLLLFCMTIFWGCRENQLSKKNLGTIDLQVLYAQSFNPDAPHGDLAEYKVTVTGSDLPERIVKVFPAGTEMATFDGLPGGTEIQIIVEYINVNGLVIRRGRAHSIRIRAGMKTRAEVVVNNVPIFTNVKDGATVVSDRFVPRIFAPGGISFELADVFDGRQFSLPEVISGELTFSVSPEEETSVRSVFIEPLRPGSHDLTVRDPETGEGTTISVSVVKRLERQGLITTAGGFVGSILGKEARTFNLAWYFKRLVEQL